MHPTNPEATHKTTRILSVVAGTCIALACGTNYAYSAWAPQFAERLSLSATQSNLIGNAGNIGMYATGIPAGLLIDSRGPRWGVLLGAIALACGYFPLRTAYDNGAGSMSVGALCFFGFLTGMGSCSAFSAAIKVCATNWPRHRGTATAFPLSGFGLSAFAFTTISGFAFPDDTSSYLLLLAVGTFVMVFTGMIFLRIIPPATPYEAVPTDERPGAKRNDSNPMHRTRSSHSRHSSKGSMHAEEDPADANESSSLVSSPTSNPGDIEDRYKHAQHAHSHAHAEITGWALLKSGKFWQLFIMLGLLCGVGLMTINNIGNNAKALWHHWDDSASHDFIQQRQLMHVSILSLMSFVGRLSSGIGSDFLIHHSLSRFWALVASACVFVCAQVAALNIENPNELFWLSGLTGLGYGALFGVYPALVADAFGPSGMGINWGAMTMAPVVSGNVFNLAYGGILDKHSHYVGQPDGSGDEVCDDGRECYSGAYYVTLVASVTAIAWSLWCIRHEHVAKARERREIEDHEG